MNEYVFLFVVVFLFYLTDCFILVHKQSVLFYSWNNLSFKHTLPHFSFGFKDRGLFVHNPFPPLGTLYVSSILPVSLSPRYICSYTSQSPFSSSIPRQTGKRMKYEAVESIYSNGNKLYINNALFAACHSSEHSRMIVSAVERMKSLSEDEREKEIGNLLSQLFDLDKVKELLIKFKDKIATLNIFCNIQFVLIYIMLPFTLFYHFSTRHFVVIAVEVYSINILIAVLHYHVHKYFFKESKYERWMNVLKMLLFPPTAIRTKDMISIHLFSAYNPIITAHEVCDRKAFDVFARRYILELKNPIEVEADDEKIIECDKWFTSLIEERCLRFAERVEIDLNELLKPPIPYDKDCLCYCPRCECQFTKTVKTCPDCVGIETKELLRS